MVATTCNRTQMKEALTNRIKSIRMICGMEVADTGIICEWLI